jgi:hypothetical protein
MAREGDKRGDHKARILSSSFTTYWLSCKSNYPCIAARQNELLTAKNSFPNGKTTSSRSLSAKKLFLVQGNSFNFAR